jgi:hypothetical protein
MFEYCRFRTAPLALMESPEQTQQQFTNRAAANDGHLFGIWRSLNLGLPRDEGIALTAWRNEAAARAAPAVDGGESTILQATLRPTTDEPPSYPGVYVFRWFDLASADVGSFLELSAKAWPNMESVFDVNVCGFWRSLDVDEPGARGLLLTRYADLSVWEASRWWSNKSADAKVSMTSFKRRSDVVTSTVAYAMMPFPPATDGIS